MDANPWLWDVPQVANFFRHDAVNYISDMPNARLPDVEQLASTLEENDVAGSVLLSGVVDTSFLKDDCGVKSLGMRSAVIHCISKLKKLATTFENQAEPAGPIPDTPQSIAAQLPQEQQQAPFPSFDATVGENVRSGEVQVQDESGRKRRKLNLLQPVEPLQSAQTSGPASYFGDKSMTVDDMFYGDTLLGDEVDTKDLMPNDDLVVDANDPRNFSFTAQPQLPGECQYVYTQMRFMMQNEKDVDLKRRGRDAVAITAYRERLQPQDKPTSVTVFQMAGEDAVAVRENAAYVASGNDYSEISEPQDAAATATTTDWDYLLEKYRSTAKEKEIAMDAESETEASTLSTGEGANSDDEDLMAEVEDDDEASSLHDRLDVIMDNFFEELAATWRGKKLMKLEEKQAWATWKKMKKSRTIQEDLLNRSKSLIDHLYARLKKFKDAMKNEVWSSEAQVLAQCRTMQPTVEDIELELWKMGVWKRKKEPSHAVRHGQHVASGSKPATSTVRQPIHIPSDDRLSVEPADAPMDVEDADAFHSAPSSPVLPQDDIAAGQNEENDASDEMSDDEGETFVVDDEDIVMQSDDASRTPTKSRTPAVKLHSLPPSTPSTAHSQRIKEPSPAPKNNDHAGAGTDSDLPSPSSFFGTQSKPEVKTPSKLASSSTVKMSDPIEISSDSTPAKPKRGRKKGTPNKKTIYSQNPELDTAKEVASWDLQDLAKNGDRKRILIKLLTEAGRPARNILIKTIRLKRVPWYREAVMDKLREMQFTFARAPLESETMVPLAARMYLAVSYPTYLREIMEATGRLSIDLPWNTITKDSPQVQTHVSMIQQFLEKQELFEPPKPVPKSSPTKISSSQVIDLLDSSEDDGPDTPQKKKKRKLLGEKAQQSQAAAFERQKRFQLLESQASNSQEIQAMIQSDPSRSTIPINVATKEEKQELIFIDKHMAATMKEHQINGVRFMWRELTAQGDEEGQGCILAHTMGLGKTMQTIATLIAINEAAQSRNRRINSQVPKHLRPDNIDQRQLRMLVLCPPQLITNWCREIEKWASHVFKNVYTVEGGFNENRRIDQMKTWHKLGGILITGFQLFLAMVNWRAKGDKYAHIGPHYDKYLLESPEIVIADEAHNLKNDKAGISRAARMIHTESRIGLTGTPMSNDVDEIYSLISFVAPDYLGERGWFTQQYSRPIKDGNSRDSSYWQRRRSLKKLAVLHRQIEPKVNRADITVLRGSLRSKVEYAVTMPLTPEQDAAYRRFIAVLSRNEDKDSASQVQIFSWLAVLTLLLNHPVTFKRKLLAPVEPKKAKRKAKPDGPSREPTPGASDSGSVTPAQGAKDDADEAAWDKVADIDGTLRVLGFSEDTINHLIADIDDGLNPALSSKMSMLMTILQLSKKCNDKVLVFTSSIPTLDYVAQLLNSCGYHCGRIDGKVPTGKRQQIVEEFNKGIGDVMLISTRAGGVGLNIQAANRVVILDSGFNPAHEEQAIGRAYRLGQEKPVYVYRLIIGGTFEDEIYNKQYFKQSLTSRVVDKKNPIRSATADTREWLFEPKDLFQDSKLEDWLGKDEKVLDTILFKQIAAGGTTSSGPPIRKLITTETLQEDAKDEPLNLEEEKEVQEELAMRLSTRTKGRKVSNLTASQSTMPPPIASQNKQTSGTGAGRTGTAPRAAKTAPRPQPTFPGRVTLKLPHGLPVPSTMPNPPPANGRPSPSGLNPLNNMHPSSTQTSQNRPPHGLPGA